MKRLLARLRTLWTQFLDNPFTMFDRSERDVDHNTMTGRTDAAPLIPTGDRQEEEP